MDGPRAPLNCGAAILRLQGRQLGTDTRRRTPTPPVPNREEIKEGGKRKRAAVVLTSRRWCSRGRLEDGRWRGKGVRGDVGVHGGVDVPAPVRLLLPTRTASSPSLERRLKLSSLTRQRRLGATAPSLGSTRRRCVCSLSLTAWSLV
jgi:hypothetical protein